MDVVETLVLVEGTNQAELHMAFRERRQAQAETLVGHLVDQTSDLVGEDSSREKAAVAGIEGQQVDVVGSEELGRFGKPVNLADESHSDKKTY